MSRWTYYVQSASEVVAGYSGELPLAPVLREYFREHPKMGSTDRRYVSDLVYAYYRLGYAARGLSVVDRLLLGYFLCRSAPSPLVDALRPKEKIAGLPFPFSVADIFPWHHQLSEGIDPVLLAGSHLVQPDVFIRIRPGYDRMVREALRQKGVSFGEISQDGLSLPHNTALQDILPLNKAYVVQDRSSQQVGSLIRLAMEEMTVRAATAATDSATAVADPATAAAAAAPAVWDCCAASGGKSILLKDILPSARLTVSDIRPSILQNLEKRFAEAGVRYERSFVADLSQPVKQAGPFDLIIADLPCSGSGTWSRTPEQLLHFQEPAIADYSRRQQAILRHIRQAVKPGGYLLLITCSVFREENESNVSFLETLGCTAVRTEIFSGYAHKADTLFGALMTVPTSGATGAWF